MRPLSSRIVLPTSDFLEVLSKLKSREGNRIEADYYRNESEKKNNLFFKGLIESPSYIIIIIYITILRNMQLLPASTKNTST